MGGRGGEGVEAEFVNRMAHACTVLTVYTCNYQHDGGQSLQVLYHKWKSGIGRPLKWEWTNKDVSSDGGSREKGYHKLDLKLRKQHQ